jgi:hypothetical protein
MQALIGKMPEKSVPVRLANRRRLFRENERTLEAARSLFLDRMGSETR